jgi:membrane-bound lytic murein transglycosylase MltF
MIFGTFRRDFTVRALGAILIVGALALAGIASAADQQALSIELKARAWPGDLDVLAGHRAIRVLVPYSKTLYFVDLGGVQRGIGYDFMHAFEDALNKKQMQVGDITDLDANIHGGIKYVRFMVDTY